MVLFGFGAAFILLLRAGFGFLALGDGDTSQFSVVDLKKL